MSQFAEHRKVLQALKEFESSIQDMVTDMGNTALNHTLESFRNQGFTDEGLVKWKPRKRNRDGRDEGRGILIGRGSGTTGLRGSYRKIQRGRWAVSIVNSKKYAAVHNEGLRAGRGTGFKMPERRMIGNSATMNRKIIHKINQRIKRIYNG